MKNALLPTVSVIIPVYNPGQFLTEAIRSVIDQTYKRIEIIIVDDASTDDLENIVKLFNDPRIIFIRHERNMGADAARKTGIHASCGEVIAFLDQDDLFHPEKIQAHIEFRERHPEIGLTYNPKFELNYSDNSIREIRRQPKLISLSDLVEGFPITPSEIVISREWALREDLWSERRLLHGGEYIFLGRLYLAGCKFGSVDRALNYRRHHSGRIFSRLRERCQDELFAQSAIFSDPRCPSEVQAIRPVAFANTYMVWGYQALIQKEIELGQIFFIRAASLNPSILNGKPCPLVKFLVNMSIADDMLDHGILLKQVFTNLPKLFDPVLKQYDQAVTMGHFLKEIRVIIWKREVDNQELVEKVARLNGYVGKSVLAKVVHQILDYEIEFGSQSAREVIDDIYLFLKRIRRKSYARWIEGRLAFNHALMSYMGGEFARVPANLFRAMVTDPKYTLNRGAWSILIRSMFYQGISKGN
jgi:glycosyltransferase involved in cell wall biosynthesis